MRKAGFQGKLTLTERMRRIGKKDTKPELLVRKALTAMGYRYRLQVGLLPGTPDIVLRRHRKIIFVHGCFWHRHNCPSGLKLPTSKPEYWAPKLEKNRIRDESNITQLRALGWDVLVIWECETMNGTDLQNKLFNFLDAPKPSQSALQS
jgi:DNA mismatch endonuclease, patch repair protein